MSITLRDLINKDLDEYFAYRTPKMVNIKDYQLGCAALWLRVWVLAYIIVFVLIIGQRYTQYETGYGTIITYRDGTAFSTFNNTITGVNEDTRIWDQTDLIYPTFEANSLSIAVKVEEIPMQKRGICIDKSAPCKSNSDCISGDCQGGYCYQSAWCSDYEPIVHDLQNVENMNIWFQGTVQYIQLAPEEEFTTLDEIAPEGNGSIYKVKEILGKGGIVFDKIKDTGCVMKVEYRWDCDFTWHKSWSPELQMERVDNAAAGAPLGFKYSRYIYYKVGDSYYRDQWNVNSIRFLISSEGVASSINIQFLILQLTTNISLIKLVPIIVNFFMLYTCMENRLEYARFKFERSKDIDQELKKMEGNDINEEDNSDEDHEESQLISDSRPSVND